MNCEICEDEGVVMIASRNSDVGVREVLCQCMEEPEYDKNDND